MPKDAQKPGTLETNSDCGPRSFALDLAKKPKVEFLEEGDTIVFDPDLSPTPESVVLAAPYRGREVEVILYRDLPDGWRQHGVGVEYRRKLPAYHRQQ